MSNKNRVLEALQEFPRGLTAAQIQARYRVGNARAEVSRLRMEGFPIYANQETDTKGRTKTFYRLGTPSRKVIAAGYRALAMGLVVEV
jgi:predicted ArsR family transcriptional regulator